MIVENKVKHNWRDGVFRYLFKESANFVQMYEVFTGRKLCPDEIEFLETDSILMARDLKNDIAFLTKSGKFIALVEHQHTENPNIAVRMMIYYAELLKLHIKSNDLNVFGTVPIEIPNAEFHVAYTGKKPWIASNQINLGAVVIKINFIDINYNKLEFECQQNVLIGYSYLLKRFEHYRDVELLDKTIDVDLAIKDCRKNGYLTDYVNREEFMTMALEYWTVEQQMEDRERWAREMAEAEAEAKARAEKLESAKVMLSDGLSAEMISKYLNIEIEQIQELIP